ncbi:hypothetical protein ACWT_4617 [Actinoplanes sp. SE50]|uniref:DUF6348 family protein n=1 Tax=unclassified Actinoplanes TaxID=2626549 RepID=UPI00023ED629|nr:MULTISPECIES: DUF6348 family protein [unclassified Actinoplanes]AEV85639.1 hypothetical protein ACPL_4748 [Actinoplanes sp. SE50/110]ATO84032.1 hypothetical protein ACWT_4617 [Actinoplanes sp. SE50]SLM01442.1 hypothetical protein ACSP50_4678 [Actinoplanes sp. SE50/110]
MINSQPLPAERVLEIAAPMLNEVGGNWRLAEGPMLRSGSMGVRLLPADNADPRHLDLEILLNADRPDVPTITDCTLGLAADPVEGARQAIGAWIATTVVTVLEMVEQQGRLATHIAADEEGAFPGWHTIVGGITGWSVDDSPVKQQWIADEMPWSALAPIIAPALDRPHLNGIRLLIGQGGDFTECEVRINGRRHEPAEAALAALDWPRTEQFGLARTFLLLVGQH